MPMFRCYALSACGRIVSGEDVEQSNLESAIDAGWNFVLSHDPKRGAVGLEVWQGRSMLFASRDRSPEVPQASGEPSSGQPECSASGQDASSPGPDTAGRAEYIGTGGTVGQRTRLFRGRFCALKQPALTVAMIANAFLC